MLREIISRKPSRRPVGRKRRRDDYGPPELIDDTDEGTHSNSAVYGPIRSLYDNLVNILDCELVDAGDGKFVATCGNGKYSCEILHSRNTAFAKFAQDACRLRLFKQLEERVHTVGKDGKPRRKDMQGVSAYIDVYSTIAGTKYDAEKAGAFCTS